MLDEYFLSLSWGLWMLFCHGVLVKFLPERLHLLFCPQKNKTKQNRRNKTNVLLAGKFDIYRSGGIDYLQTICFLILLLGCHSDMCPDSFAMLEPWSLQWNFITGKNTDYCHFVRFKLISWWVNILRLHVGLRLPCQYTCTYVVASMVIIKPEINVM